MIAQNLFTDLLPDPSQETFETLLETAHLKLERIVSQGQATPPGEWLHQAREEWVLLLQGGAGLAFEGEPNTLVLRPGDHLRIPAGVRHRVAWTAPEGPTVWLALHHGVGDG